MCVHGVHDFANSTCIVHVNRDLLDLLSTRHTCTYVARFLRLSGVVEGFMMN